MKRLSREESQIQKTGLMFMSVITKRLKENFKINLIFLHFRAF